MNAFKCVCVGEMVPGNSCESVYDYFSCVMSIIKAIVIVTINSMSAQCHAIQDNGSYNLLCILYLPTTFTSLRY